MIENNFAIVQEIPPVSDNDVNTVDEQVDEKIATDQADREAAVLVKLLREYLRPYRGPIAIIVALQFLATLAMLYLPSSTGTSSTGGATGTPGTSGAPAG